MLRRRLIGGGILLAAVGYTAVKVIEFLTDRVKEESRKIEEEKKQESESSDTDQAPEVS